jgi:hypothetical protein
MKRVTINMIDRHRIKARMTRWLGLGKIETVGVRGGSTLSSEIESQRVFDGEGKGRKQAKGKDKRGEKSSAINERHGVIAEIKRDGEGYWRERCIN